MNDSHTPKLRIFDGIDLDRAANIVDDEALSTGRGRDGSSSDREQLADRCSS